MRQIDSEGHSRYGVLQGAIPIPNAERETQTTHADAVDRELPIVAFTLGVFEV
jgi:hypothetical protein